MSDRQALRTAVDRALADGKPADAVCSLAELVADEPGDRHLRLALAVSIGDAGRPAAALMLIRALADRLAHDGMLLPAIIAVRHGLTHAPQDAELLATLRRIHVRAARAKAGDLPKPPPLKAKAAAAPTDNAEALLALPLAERLERATLIGKSFPPAGEAAIPLPLPLFCELDETGFVETVRRLHFKRVATGTKVLVEGQPGDSLLVIASGHVDIDKGGKRLATLGPGTVLGEMALMTGAPRSASAVAKEEVEYFALSREDVEALAQSKPAIAEELFEYCRKRLVSNVLQSSPLFVRFDESARFKLLERFTRQGFKPGDTIIAQDSAGKGLYVVVAGEVEVSVKNDAGEAVVVANLAPGEVFGEISLLNDQPTVATVRARGAVGLLFLPREEFLEAISKEPAIRDYLKGLSADRLKAARAASEVSAVIDANDLIVL